MIIAAKFNHMSSYIEIKWKSSYIKIKTKSSYIKPSFEPLSVANLITSCPLLSGWALDMIVEINNVTYYMEIGHNIQDFKFQNTSKIPRFWSSIYKLMCLGLDVLFHLRKSYISCNGMCRKSLGIRKEKQ